MTTGIPSPTVDSPLLEGASADLVCVLKSDTIINGYQTIYGIDVAKYFANVPCVSVYECQATHYRFYHPYSLVGQERLYSELEKFEWTYKNKKWEYDQAIKYIPKGSRVLDVGCGRGAFLKTAAQAGLDCYGIELNKSAVEFALSEGLRVSAELVGDHAVRFPKSYDAVCSFQVLEHIADVRNFITGCIRVLKPGGAFIVGVPNNESFLQYDSEAVLNMPPHHMGLWTSRSLSALKNIFPLNLRKIELEPLAEIEWYASVMERKYLTERWLRRAFYASGLSRLTRWYITSQAERIAGHTILAIFQKR